MHDTGLVYISDDGPNLRCFLCVRCLHMEWLIPKSIFTRLRDAIKRRKEKP